MAFNGGIYGDYEFTSKATRVLEGRKSAKDIYYSRLFHSKGSWTPVYLSGISSILFYMLGGHFFQTKGIACKQLRLYSIGASLFGAQLSYYFFSSLLSNTEELKYLLNNKENIISAIEERLIEDQKERYGALPDVLKSEVISEEIIVSEEAENKEEVVVEAEESEE
jgi:hypothetical protein